MMYSLMNKDTETLRFDLDRHQIEVIDNARLPFALRDYVRTTSDDIDMTISSMDCIRDFLQSRLLSLSRSGAKAILNVADLPQSLKTAERLKISMACRGLTMTDNYWLGKDGEDVKFDDVCLRKRPLSEKSYFIAILEKRISATRQELRPDLSAGGMFPKFWKRNGNAVELWKTDRVPGHPNVMAEVSMSDALDKAENIPPYVKYRVEETDGLPFSVSGCFVDDAAYFVTASDMNDYLMHTKSPMSLVEYATRTFPEFADMVVIDYIFANTDRHVENWGFLADSGTDEIVGMAPLFDHNQALIADYVGTDIDGLIYDPTGMTFAESVKTYASKSRVKFNPDLLPTEGARKRYETMSLCRG